MRSSTLLAALLALAACSPPQPPDTPETPAASSDPAAASPEPTAAPAVTAMPGAVLKSADADKSASLEGYELTPSDCDALGRQYGAVARADQLATLSPKLSTKQRDATAAQIDKVVGKLEDSWIASCQSTLVNKSVEHAAVKCALASKTVKQFDVCLNGENGTPQAKPSKKK